ncbi:immunoglobulin-like domain-containing protein [Dyadobacter sp. NIV53]|uniref:immunoglobulin-like domain-containing protein n=1 Tax=Dyadobacter sp. NIV53 TaxID=2861765 RepID=UPI001C87F728|nr:immunoglobulin-like domain-containing protein [Dyadobacter sp. NIV53]
MIKEIRYIAIVIFAGIFFACEPDKTSEDISNITFFPVITLKGEQWEQITLGTKYTDPGVDVKEGETDITAKVTGTVDEKTAGVYVLQYDAVNKDGYSSREYRYVGVIDPAIKGTDITGAYKRNAGEMGISNVTKVSGNLYHTDNIGGVAIPNAGLGVYFYYYAKGKLGVPFQLTPGNSFEATNGAVVEGVQYSWIVINAGYGTAVRTFIKQ